MLGSKQTTITKWNNDKLTITSPFPSLVVEGRSTNENNVTRPKPDSNSQLLHLKPAFELPITQDNILYLSNISRLGVRQTMRGNTFPAQKQAHSIQMKVAWLGSHVEMHSNPRQIALVEA